MLRIMHSLLCPQGIQSVLRVCCFALSPCWWCILWKTRSTQCPSTKQLYFSVAMGLVWSLMILMGLVTRKVHGKAHMMVSMCMCENQGRKQILHKRVKKIMRFLVSRILKDTQDIQDFLLRRWIEQLGSIVVSCEPSICWTSLENEAFPLFTGVIRWALFMYQHQDTISCICIRTDVTLYTRLYIYT